MLGLLIIKLYVSSLLQVRYQITYNVMNYTVRSWHTVWLCTYVGSVITWTIKYANYKFVAQLNPIGKTYLNMTL